MKRSSLLFALISTMPFFVSANFLKIRGAVLSEGKGIANVVVTDGSTVVKTDEKGRYSLNLNPSAKYVYVSSPAGYEVATVNSVPLFFVKVDSLKSERVDFMLKKSHADDVNHNMIFWADPQVKKASDVEKLKEAARDLKSFIEVNKPISHVAIGCGDIVFDRLNLFKDHNDVVETVGIPFYEAVGNHDMDYNNRSNDGSKKSFEKVYGPSYYSFNKGKVHYVVLDNVFYLGRDFYYIGYCEEKQLAWLKQDLSFIPKGSTIVVTLHIPTALDSSDIAKFNFENISKSQTNKEALYELLDGYNAHIVSGHMHNTYNVDIRKNIREHILSSVCGSWWYGNVAQDGTPQGYGVFEVRGDSLTWYFKSIGHDKFYQLRYYPLGANKELPNFVTANVWNWSSKWKVYWYEDDVKMGEMERYTGFDPETLSSYANPSNTVPKWVKPMETSHLFRVQPKSKTSNIKIEAIDEFGRSYWSR